MMDETGYTLSCGHTTQDRKSHNNSHQTGKTLMAVCWAEGCMCWRKVILEENET